ncbi:MAG: PAS domain-containing protein, partial [Bacteroidia bacterium]
LLMVVTRMTTDDVIRIGVTYSVAALTIFVLIEYLRKTERELASRNRDLTDIFNSSPIPVMLMDDAGKIIMINEACTELFGFVKAELCGKFIHDIFYSETREKASERLRHYKRSLEDNRTLHIEEEYKKRNHETTVISADIKPIILHEEKYILFVGLDVTRESRLKNDLNQAHKLYQSMASNIPNSVVYMFDRQLRFLLVEGGDIHKGSSHNKKITGKKLREAFPISLANQLEDHFQATLLGVESSVEVTYQGKHFVFYFHPVYSEKKEITTGLAMSVNISELHRTKTEVKLKNKMIEAYAHKASHIVRRPVANLIGLADILLNQKNSEEERRTILKFIYDSVLEMDNSLKEAAVELGQAEKSKETEKGQHSNR